MQLVNFTMHKKSMLTPSISKKAFWDISFDKLDYEKSSLFVMQKVFNYGSWEDQLGVIRFYRLERIKKEITKASYLRQPVLSFLCTILKLEKTDFSYYNFIKNHPLPRMY